ncbi:unnamed protein product [Adineta steineri]|uniref:Uncharacterized protein n=1 Tax=Adineta steineri TaxID=433720 RepID=A0A814V7G5_9BILA|nr:unnamed protein product [Adineta steineri]
MNVYNSSNNSNEDDADLTMINHSFLYGQNDEPMSTCLPVLRRLQQTNQSPSDTQAAISKPINNRSNTNFKNDHKFADSNLIESAEQIEQILEYYRKELKQESNTQLDCDRQLITRLTDFIRPIYSSNQKKMKDLDILFDDISILHDKRFFDEKEQNEQLHTKIRHLKKSMVSPTNDDDDSRNSLMTNLYRINSIVDYERWMEMEEDSRKLQNLVQTQRDQIDKLIELLSQQETINNENKTLTVNELHPTTKESLNDITKRCSLCNFEFPLTYTEEQIINHFEKCLTTTSMEARNMTPGAKQLECPYCSKKLETMDDMIYLDHVAKCCNGLADLLAE